jgi:benzoyl-CoA reductase/2-hydroxyglutaryl-CoA dehydratase subunit BcrC/BadD/HgdB
MDTRTGSKAGLAAYACSYVPEEIILAAGMTPKRLIPRARPTEADGVIYPNTCHYIKSLLAEGLNENASTDVFIIANSCDGMRRLHDLWGEYVTSVPALFLDVPKKKDADSIDFFSSELRAFAGKLEKWAGGVSVTEARLQEAAVACNQARALIHEVQRLQARPDSGVDGMSVFELYLKSARLHPSEMAKEIRAFLSAPRQTVNSSEDCRIVLGGNVMYRPDLLELIRACGGRVAAIDTCLGARHFDGLVPVDSADPMRALAGRYLTKASCPRMEGIAERAAYLRQMAADSLASGIIYSMVKFCDSHLYDIPFLQNYFRQAGLPFLFLENDYEWSGLGQMKVRVEAFLAHVREKEATSHV